MINCHVWFVVALFVCVAEHEHLINKNERVLLTIGTSILASLSLLGWANSSGISLVLITSSI